MGVKDLWAILAPVMIPVPLADLKGQTLAVDLSIWIVETQGVRQMQGVVTKPYLRNLFFRINHLLQLGINLIFVIEGEAPKLKWETMAQRTQVRYGGAGRGRGNPTSQKPPKRSHFNAVIKECCHLLDAIGVPYVQSAGEAEAKCAFLNAKGIVEGCLTDDGDVFLYGARKVYRNFTMKDPHIESYDMADIEQKLGLDRSHVVALGLLLGCDYVPKGVPGVGREMALKFFKHIGKQNVLERFDIWVKDKKHYAELEATAAAKKPPHCSQCKHPGSAREHDRKGCTLCQSSQHCEPQAYDYVCTCDWHHKQQEVSTSAFELNIQKRAIQTNGFPWPKVVEEFMISKDKVSRNKLSWHCPRLNPFIHFCETKMEWVEDYSRDKLLPLMTLWGMRAQLGIYDDNGKQFLKPHCIVKTRVRLGVPCFEVQWGKLSEDSTFKEDHYTTIEEAEIFTQCFPETVVLFEAMKPVKTKRKPAKAKDEVSDKENVDLTDITTAITDMKLSDEKEKPSGRRTAQQIGHLKGVEMCEEKTTIQPDEVQKGNKEQAKQSPNEDDNTVTVHLHEQNTTWKEQILPEPLHEWNSQHLNMPKVDDRLRTPHQSLYRQNCLGSTTHCIEVAKPNTSDTMSSAESSSEEEEYLPLSQRLALLPKINKKPSNVKDRQTSFVYRVSHKSAVRVKSKADIKVDDMPVNCTEYQQTDQETDVPSNVHTNRNCEQPSISQEVIEDLELVFEDTKTGKNSALIKGDSSPRNRSMQVTSSMPHVQAVKDQPSESELVSLLMECSLQNNPSVPDADTTEKAMVPPSSPEGIALTSSSDCKTSNVIVKTKDERGGTACAEDIGSAVNAECLGKTSQRVGGRRKPAKGKVRKSSKPWYTESVLEFSSDDDLVFDLHGDGNAKGRTFSHTESNNNKGSLTGNTELLLEEKSNCIKDSKLDDMMKIEEGDIMEAPEEDGCDITLSETLEQSVETGACSVLEGGFIREDSVNVTDGLDDSSNLSQLEGGFFRETTSLFKFITTNGSSEALCGAITPPLSYSVACNAMSPVIANSAVCNADDTVCIAMSPEAPKEQSAAQTDIAPPIYRDSHSDSRYSSYVSDSVEDTSSELSGTDLFENASKCDHECDMTLPVKNCSVGSFLDATPTVVFIDTPFSSPIAEVTTDLPKIESPKLKTNFIEKPVSTTAVNWNKSQFGNFSMGCTLLDITSDSYKPDTSRYTQSPEQHSIYGAKSHLGSTDQSLCPSTPNGTMCGTMGPLAVNSTPCDARSPVSATITASNAYGTPCGAMSPSTTNPPICDRVSPVAVHSVSCEVLSPVTANSALPDVMSPDSVYNAMSPVSSGSALYDAMVQGTVTSALSDAISPVAANRILSDAKLPIISSSSGDTSVFAAASPIPLAQRLLKRVDSHIFTQFSQPSQTLRTLSQPWAQQSPQHSTKQSLKSKYPYLDDSDITLLDG